jgi:hypothetical protein
MPGTDNFCVSEAGPFGVTLRDLGSFLPAASATVGGDNGTASETRSTPVTGRAGKTGGVGIYAVAVLAVVMSGFVWLF